MNRAMALRNQNCGLGPSRARRMKRIAHNGGNAVRKATTRINGFQAILARKEAELLHAGRGREGITIEKSADQMDEIQYALERDLAIHNVDHDFTLLRDIRAAQDRIRDGTYGICIQCEEAISPKRLKALPWAARCINCQEAADRNGGESPEAWGGALALGG
jgi:DnaK suppressor protein